MALTQSTRHMGVTTPLGSDVLGLHGMSATEELGRLFTYELDLVSDNPNIDLNELLGESITVWLEMPDESKRYLNGICSRISQGSISGTLISYRATVRPWLWLLTRRADCRIFQGKTVPTIIKDVVGEHGFSGDLEERLSGSYRTWDYCVQYRETDFNFLSRLMEEEGIYYFFTHKDGKHTMVLCDASLSHHPFPDYSEIPFYPPAERARRERDHLSEWSIGREVQTGTYTLTDYDFTRPKADLTTRAKVSRDNARSSFEFYDYPGEYTQTSDGQAYATVRIQELQARYERARAAGDVRGLAAGWLFTLTGYPRTDQNHEYLIVSSILDLQSDAFEVEAGVKPRHEVRCAIEVMDSKEPFRPLRLTPKPTIAGPQTAVVVGPSGQEIYTDEYGRVKVQFHWDRLGKDNETSSCWVRVAQIWAGKKWGGIAIPRIGQEVIVEFLEGDPDQPIITGRVYNADNMPPYDLPANKTQAGIKSRSSMGGGTDDFNELRFEDKKGEEQVYLHAQKNQDILVENDETHSVGHDRTKDIGNDETTHVKHDRTETVDNDETITIHGNRTETVDKDETITIHGNRTETVDKNETITIHGNRKETVDKNETITISGARTETVTKDETITINANRTESVAKNETITISGARTETVTKDETITINGGRTESVAKDEAVSIKGGRSHNITKDDALKVGKNLVVDAGDSITIKTGSASISMKKDGTISIKGKDISIEGSGKINVKASSDIVMKGSKILQN